MKNFLFLICVILPIFFNNNLGVVIGIEQMMTVTIVPLVIYCVYILSTKGVKNNKVKKAVYFLFFISLFACLIKVIIGQTEFLRDLMYMGFLPCIIILAFENLTAQMRKILRFVLLAFFLILAVVIFLEWIMKVNFFYIENDFYGSTEDFEGWAFRSQGFFNHPIYTSMVVSLFMMMMLFSQLKLSLKMFLSGIVFFMLLCINTRTGIGLSFLLFLPSLYYNIRNVNASTKKWIAATGILLCGGIIYVVLTTELGGRLLGYGTDDGGNTQQRIASLDFRRFISDDLFLFGNSDYQVGLFQTIGWIENSYIAFLLKYGVIAGLPLLLSLLTVHIYQLKRFPLVGQICIFSSFYLFAATTTHLAAPNIWLYFIFLYYAFAPYRTNRDRLYRKYVQSLYLKKEKR